MTREVIDQRAQRHDPASTNTEFADEPRADTNSDADKVAGRPETHATIRDKGHSRVVDDLPDGRDIKG
ncbi:hypothetical protein [Falsirhodobacter sp. alg1]|uniref:hypothetical protein n=1 Tax=Falsirhodobacter sp. alg1 TaxID=1472418 RepID=UPI00128F86EB|nr:hypothetical protein [Falsirhodobacter sp. alg1]